MKTFISGGTGVLGRRVVMRLLDSGHQVVGLSRSPNNTRWLRSVGAQAVEGDLFQTASLTELAGGCTGVLHLATSIPEKTRTTRDDWLLNDKIRLQGTRAMLQTALNIGAELFICQGLLGILGNQGQDWIDSDVEPIHGPGGVLQSAYEMERIIGTIAAENALPARILRFGMFYSADSDQTQGMLSGLARGMFPVFGRGNNYWSLIHADDAADAIVASVSEGSASGSLTLNVCDNEPVQTGKLFDFLASELGARRPLRLPSWTARLMLGKHVAEYLLASIRARNTAAVKTLGWQPSYPTYVAGYPAVIGRWRSH